MTWEDIKRKLSSRKFWALLAVFVVALLKYLGVLPEGQAGGLNDLILLGGACVAYMLSESAVDVARIIGGKNDSEEPESDNDE